MLNRHFLRAKVLQSVYAYHIGEKNDISQEEKLLFANIDKLYDLEIYLLSTLFEMKAIAEDEIEEGKNKYYPTEEELNPNMRFVNNPMFSLLEDCRQLKDSINKLHINWRDQKEVLRSIFDHFKASESYKTYMAQEEVGFEEHRRIIVQLFKNYIIKNDNFFDELAEKSFSWLDDFDFICQIVIVLLRNWKEGESFAVSLPSPFEKTIENELESDRDYVKNLFRNTILHWDEYESLIEKRALNWDRDRMAFIDVVIIKMAISELVYAPTIPVRVTLNEYIELAKEFSTEKSRLFVNGILDRIIIDLKMADKIHKIDTEEYTYDYAKKDEEEND